MSFRVRTAVLTTRFRSAIAAKHDHRAYSRNSSFIAEGRTIARQETADRASVNVDGSDTTGYVVAVDTVGAGFHERVLVVAGSSARLAQGMKDTPVDAAIVGVIDTVDIAAE